MVAFRPTLLRLAQFLIPSDKPVYASSGRGASFNVNTYTLKAIHNQIKWLVHRHKRPVTDWLRQKMSVALSLHSVSVLLQDDAVRPLYYSRVRNVGLSVAVFPDRVQLRCSLMDVAIDDVSEGRGLYPSILCIDRTSEDAFVDMSGIDRTSEDAFVDMSGIDRTSEDAFVDMSVTVNTRESSPSYPHYRVGVELMIHAPVLVLRYRIVDEVMNYFFAGPMHETILLLKQAIEAKKRRLSEQVTHSPSLFKGMYSSALQYGKEFLEKEENRQLPLLRLHVTNCEIRVPRSSTDEDYVAFELGQLDVWNQKPGAPTALNTVQLHLSNMHAFTATTYKQYVIGNVSCRMQFVVSQCLELAAHISKLSIALNERQIDFFAQMVRGNLSERAVCSSGDVCRASSRRDKPQKRRSSLQSVGRTVACSVVFDGICLEYLLSDGGYAYTASGDDMYQSVGSQAVGKE